MLLDDDTGAAATVVGVANVVVAAAVHGVFVTEDEEPVLVLAGDPHFLGGIDAEEWVCESHVADLRDCCGRGERKRFRRA